MKTRISVGMGEIKVTDAPDVVLVALGLGSCVGVVLYEPWRRTAAMLHIVLPRSQGRADDKGFRFADLAIPGAIDLLSALGANPRYLRAAIAGGASMFSFGAGSHINIGESNVEAVRNLLAAARVPILIDDTGGDTSRTLVFDAETAEVSVKRAGGEEVLLGTLAGFAHSFTAASRQPAEAKAA
ncbi:MAG: chemotaxis protein CheD [Armatimonadetes bacterium]|nr:chemotaxis protein CheD [Armatimonadota bacterium]